MQQSLDFGSKMAVGGAPTTPSSVSPPACLRSACQQSWLLRGRPGSRPASLRVPPSTRAAVSPGCLPWTHADSAGPAPGWYQLQGRYWSRQLSTGLPLEHVWEGRRRNHFPGLAHPPARQPAFTSWPRSPLTLPLLLPAALKVLPRLPHQVGLVGVRSCQGTVPHRGNFCLEPGAHVDPSAGVERAGSEASPRGDREPFPPEKMQGVAGRG